MLITFRRQERSWLVKRNGILVVCVGAVMMAAPASVGQNVGTQDYKYGTAVGAPTSDKPQSKLWWNAGSWWGCLYNPSAAGFDIYLFNPTNQSWVDTGTVVDTRIDARMDALWDGLHLYIASGSLSADAYVLRYSFDPGSRTYSLDPGFPVTVRSGEGQSICLAKDSLGRLWVTFTQNDAVWVRHSTTSDTTWTTPYIVPSAGTADLTNDDVSAIVAFQGNDIGVMWSNQTDLKTYFCVHPDVNADTSWGPSEIVLPPPGGDPSLPWSDNHINLKALNTNASGKVYAALKTSLDATSNDNAPLLMLAVRDSSGTWSAYTFGRVSDGHTRPQIEIDEEHSFLYMFATSPDNPGGTIYYKSTPLASIQFQPGLGTPFIQSSTYTNINNVTSTKQNLNSTTGLLALASDAVYGYYLHNSLDLSGSIPLYPTADAYVQDGSYANSNFGSATTLLVKSAPGTGFNRDSYLTFNIAGLTNGVSKATLNLYASLTSGGTGLATSVYAVPDTSWLENGITWNNRPALGTLLGGTTVVGTKRAWYSIDVTPYLQQLVAAGQTQGGVALHSGAISSGPAIGANSRETSNPPNLFISPVGTNPTPAAPTNLAANPVSYQEIDLAWADNSVNEDGFKIERSTDDLNFSQIGAVGPNMTNFADTNVAQTTTYYYRVRAYHTTTPDSAYTNVASTTTPEMPPASPSGLSSAAVSSSEIDLNWTDGSNNEDGFYIEKSTDGAVFTQVGSVAANVTSYRSTGLTASTTYYYRVRAFNSGGTSGYTNVASGTTWPSVLPTPPSAPSGLAATAPSSSEVDLTWTDNSNNETGFHVERSLDGVSFTMIGDLPANTTAYTDLGLTASTLYYYRVSAYNLGGASGYANTSISTPAVVTVVRTAIADSYVRDGTYANSNFGSAKTLYVKYSTASGYNRIAYFGFDLTGIPTSVRSATVNFYASLTATPSLNATLYSLADSSWQESTVTWNNRPAFGQSLATLTVATTSYAWYQLDVTGYVESQRALGSAQANFSMNNEVNSSGNLIQINSREAGANPPQLVVMY